LIPLLERKLDHTARKDSWSHCCKEYLITLPERALALTAGKEAWSHCWKGSLIPLLERKLDPTARKGTWSHCRKGHLNSLLERKLDPTAERKLDPTDGQDAQLERKLDPTAGNGTSFHCIDWRVRKRDPGLRPQSPHLISISSLIIFIVKWSPRAALSSTLHFVASILTR
jgi:hypothetical protein